jgi:ribonuclease HI
MMSRKKKKFYAVLRGRKKGIFDEWKGNDGAHAQVTGFPGASYRGFRSRSEAEEWLRTGDSDERFDRFDEKTDGCDREPDIVDENTSRQKPDGIVMFTDGGCIRNPGPGGYGVVIRYDAKKKELSGGFRSTTNNRMELMACIAGLKELKPGSTVILHSDSQYVVNGIVKGWARRWRASGWMRNRRSPAENADLWAQLLDLIDRHTVDFKWVKGHAGNPDNERCDRLAARAASKTELPPDRAYEEDRTQVRIPPLYDRNGPLDR